MLSACRIRPTIYKNLTLFHPSLSAGSNAAATLDRYTVIRRYFRKQAVMHSKDSIKLEIIQKNTFNIVKTICRSGASLSCSRGFQTSGLCRVEDQRRCEDWQEHAPKQPHPMPSDYPKFYRRLALSLPHLPRPTRDDFLNVATGFWQRVRIRFKWFTIKSFRKWNADDISAFFTWFLMTQTVWVLVGTTTFFSVIFATANSLRLQEYIAGAISRYLTSETGVTVAFESAIVPKWKDSRISFKNVYISRRSASAQIVANTASRNDAHKVAARLDVGNHPAYHDDGEDDVQVLMPSEAPFQELNYSFFDLNVDSIDVTLSLKRWLDGKGLIKDATVKGVRGILDRRPVGWDLTLDPADFRHTPRPGDFELDSLQLEDILITVYQPAQFRPYTASIFRGEIRRLRKQWLFYDLLSAENIVGQFDNCLFSLHKPQSMGRTTEEDLKDGRWKRMSRFRIDGVNIDHLRTVAVGGPISWITSGKLDAVVDIKFPSDPENDIDINAIISEIASTISNAASSQVANIASSVSDRIPGQRELAKPPLRPPSDEPDGFQVPRPISIDIDLRFRDLKAAVPIFTSELSYVNNALIRPIVAFINANRTLVPIHCRILKDLDSFNGAWTMWETGLMDDISLKTYDALAHHVTHVNLNRRLKTVSLWSLQLTANALLNTLRNIIDSGRFRELYIS